MIRITLIGSGNVAQHLIKAFSKSEAIEIVQVFSRKKETLASLIDYDKIVNDFEDLKEADLYIITVSDNAISEVSQQLPFNNQLVVHTSGAASIETLDDKNRKGVFYPLQTFSKNKDIDFSVIPICLEAENTFDFRILETVAKSISNAVFPINSEQRKALHVAAVFVNNFTNHLYQIGQEICEENQVSFEILKPLIQETAEKIKTLDPIDAQTGPAKRHDSSTIETHLNYLTKENQKNIYKILTQSIQHNGKKL
ncbi:NADP oxidoreductase coenzyme F420-dependent [compost metagenome]